MGINEVENASYPELKAGRSEFVEKLADVEHSDLALRFVQARTDAKQRDEKLSEQGQTIAALQESLTDLREQVAAQKDAIRVLEDRGLTDATSLREQHNTIAEQTLDLDTLKEMVSEKKEQVASQKNAIKALEVQVEQDSQSLSDRGDSLRDAGEQLNTQTDRANRLKNVATQHHSAIANAAKLLNEALAAQAVDTADKGE